MVGRIAIAACCALFSINTSAQEAVECIEIADKPLQCEHFIIKKTDPTVARSSRIDSPSVCICLSDFPFLYEVPVGQPSDAAQQVLDQWELSASELSQLLQF